MYQQLHDLDIYLFQIINHLPHNPLMDLLAIFIHLLTLTGIIFFVISVYFYFKSSKKERFVPVLAIILWFITFAINFFIFKPLFQRTRPPLKLQQTITIGVIPDSNSFPSGQSATAIAYALPFWLYSHNKRLKQILLIIVLLTGFDRIYMGHHYPADVMAGYFSGGLTGIMGSFFYRKLSYQKIINSKLFYFFNGF